MHTCAVSELGELWCWGRNDEHQIDQSAGYVLAPRRVTALGKDVTDVASGGTHSCAIKNDDRLWCWGDNGSGELGTGTFGGLAEPQMVGLTSVTAVTAGDAHTCALAAGKAYCWGSDFKGKLGNGSPNLAMATPTPVKLNADAGGGDFGGVIALTAGFDHNCAVRTDGLWCWGSNVLGQLAATGASAFPNPVQLLASVLFAAGGDNGTCVITGMDVTCWGSPWGSPALSDPVTIQGLAGAKELAVGLKHACARQGDDTVRCWGENYFGQLGDGTTNPAASPVTPKGIGKVRQIMARENHTCAIDQAGSMWCWGYNFYGQLGRGSDNADINSMPAKIVQSCP